MNDLSLRPHPNSVWLLVSAGLDDPLTRQFMAHVNSHRLDEACELVKSVQNWEHSSLWTKHMGVALQGLGRLADSAEMFLQSIAAAASDDTRTKASGAGNLGVVAFRRQRYEEAHMLAIEAVRTNPRIVAPYTLGAAAAGKMRNQELEHFWARAILTAMPDFASRPVCRLFVSDPDSAEFLDSDAWRSELAPLLSRN